MATIVFAWELGGDYGHLSRLLPVALALRERGHRPVFVLRDLLGAEALLSPHDVPALQAPLWLGRLTQLPSPISYPELLMPFGFLNPRALTGICRAWRHLLALIQPDLLVLDHAPTALLATRGLGLPRLHFGDGFCMPPPCQPLPPFAWWQQPAPTARLQDSEAHALATANQVLAALHAPALTAFADLLHCDAQALCSFAELDHYPQRSAAPAPAPHYLGPIFQLGQGQEPCWPDGPGPRIFAYLKPGYGPLEQVLRALQELPASVLAHVPGASRKTLAQFSGGRMQLSAEPLAMDALSRSCDLALSHGGAGTTAAMLLAGKPLLLLPMQTEQWMAARRLQSLGVSETLLVDQTEHLPRLLRQMLDTARYRTAAQAFAHEHRDYRQQDSVAAVVQQCEALLACERPLQPEPCR